MNLDNRHISQMHTNASKASAENSSYDQIINRPCQQVLHALIIISTGHPPLTIPCRIKLLFTQQHQALSSLTLVITS